jgi:hypothetical protein
MNQAPFPGNIPGANVFAPSQPMLSSEPTTVNQPENLAEILSPKYLTSFGQELKQRTEDEYAIRKRFIDIIRSSMNALGLTQYLNKSMTQPQQSNLVDATFLQTWLQLKNEFTAELFPPFKIATTDIPHRSLINTIPEGNKQLEQLDNYAQIIEEDINNKLNREWSDWIKELEKAIGSAFLTGSAICKVYMDPILNRPVVRMINPENILIGDDEPSLETARFIGHVYELTEEELNIYMAKGIFRTVDIPDDNDFNDQNSIPVKTLEKAISGIDDITSKSDTLKKYRFVETQIWECPANNQDPELLSDNDEANYTYYPYTVHTHIETGTIMAYDPCWELTENGIEKRQTMFQLTFNEGDNFWGLGLGQLCIGLHNTATNIIRDLTNSLSLANAPTLIMSQNLAPQQSSIDLKYGQINQIAAPATDIKESLFNIPFQQPDGMYKEFWSDLRELINRVAGISTVRFENMPANVQGNFLLALMDKENKPMSVVLQHFQFGINQMFKILHKLLREEWANKPIIPQVPQLTYGVVYSPLISIISALDPSMSNSASQLVRMQSILDSALQSPQLHNLTAVYKRLYQIMKIDNIDEILLPEQVVQQQQQQAQEAAAQQQQQQAQAQQAQQQLLEKDVNNKAQAEANKHELDLKKAQNDFTLSQLKIQNERLLSEIKMRFELIKEKGEVTKQKNIEIANMDQALRKYIVDGAKLKADTGMELPDLPLPDLEDYHIEQYTDKDMTMAAPPV